MGFVDSRQGIRKLEIAARAHGYFLLRARIRWGRVCRIGALHGRSWVRALVHGPCGAALRGKWARRGAAASRRGAVSDVDVTAAEFARISGENAREYPETHGMDARGGRSQARRGVPAMVRGRGKF